MSKIESGVALLIGGGAIAMFSDVLGTSYGLLSAALFGLGGLLVAVGVYQELKDKPNAK